MGLKKITFDGSSVSSKIDADINYHLGSCKADGIIRGLGDELIVTTSNNYIYLGSGYVSIYGRRIYVEDKSSVYISLDSTKIGYVIIQVDLSSNEVSLTKVEGTSSPTLTKENLSSGGSLYQMPIVKYSKTTSSLTIDTSFKPNYIETTSKQISTATTETKSYVKSTYGYWTRTYPDSQSGTSYRYNIDSTEYGDGVIFVNINDKVIVTVPGNYLNNHSNASIDYYYNGTLYSLQVEKLSSQAFLLTTPSSDHEIEQIYCVR